MNVEFDEKSFIAMLTTLKTLPDLKCLELIFDWNQNFSNKFNNIIVIYIYNILFYKADQTLKALTSYV